MQGSTRTTGQRKWAAEKGEELQERRHKRKKRTTKKRATQRRSEELKATDGNEQMRMDKKEKDTTKRQVPCADKTYRMVQEYREDQNREQKNTSSTLRYNAEKEEWIAYSVGNIQSEMQEGNITCGTGRKKEATTTFQKRAANPRNTY